HSDAVTVTLAVEFVPSHREPVTVRTYDLLPAAIVVAAALGLLLVGRVRRLEDLRWRPWAALLAAVAALGAELWLGATVGTLFGGGWGQDRFSLFAKAALLLGLVTLVASADWDDELTWETAPLAFLAVFAGMVAASATSLVGLWAWRHFTRRRSREQPSPRPPRLRCWVGWWWVWPRWWRQSSWRRSPASTPPGQPGSPG